MQFKLSREKYYIRQMVREFEKENKMEFTLGAFFGVAFACFFKSEADAAFDLRIIVNH